MTNPDNVGGLLNSEFEKLMRRMHKHGDSDERHIWDEAIRIFRELCRAAPAGGDDWPFVEEIGRDGKPTGYWLRKGSPAAARNAAPVADGADGQLYLVPHDWLRDVAQGALCIDDAETFIARNFQPALPSPPKEREE